MSIVEYGTVIHWNNEWGPEVAEGEIRRKPFGFIKSDWPDAPQVHFGSSTVHFTPKPGDRVAFILKERGVNLHLGPSAYKVWKEEDYEHQA